MARRCPSCGLEGIPSYVKVCDCGYNLETPTMEPLSDKKRSSTYSRQMIIECPNCKYEGPGEYYKPGSGWIELVLWVFLFWTLFIIPTIYTVWRLTKASYRCPGCGYNFVVKKAIARSEIIRDYTEINETSKDYGKIPKITMTWSRVGWIILGIFLILIGVPMLTGAIEESKWILLIFAIGSLGVGVLILYINFVGKQGNGELIRQNAEYPKNTSLRWIAIAIMVFLFFFVILMHKPKGSSIKITARELYAKYEANTIQADELYKDKLLEVFGVVESIGKDILGNPYVTLKTDNAIGSVQCMLADSEKSKASELSKGQSIVIEGKNSGKLMNIILRNCKIK